MSAATSRATQGQVAEQLAAYGDSLLGLIPADRIRQVGFERPAPALIDGFRKLRDLTSTVADILDEMGYDTAIPASELPPLQAGQRMVGPAVTVRHAPARLSSGYNIAKGNRPPQLGGRDQVALCQRGDVMVIEARGIRDASNFGGLMATSVKEAGIEGLVIDGCVRDVANMRAMHLAVWARGITPRTGKHRIELVEFNGPVDIAGVQVRPGDLLLGDCDGVIVVPLEVAAAVLERAQAATVREEKLVAALEQGASPQETARILPPEKW
ncbi:MULTISPECIES: RraA family protein [Polaromonas]|uniref:Putative 4-hydroxy-4-methyl-2-oxoglutarate aldolase n=1 Tax=Polaromonas aquatica TaxID=332657 RepID=A0ABW1TV63_9BURK